MTKDFTKEFPHVEQYFWTMVNQPKVKKILGEVKQADAVPAVVHPNKKVAASAKEQKQKPKHEVKIKELAKPKVEDPPAADEEEEAPKPRHQKKSRKMLVIQMHLL